MSHKRAPLTKHIEAFKSETRMLLRFFLSFKRIIKFSNFNEISRKEYVDLLIALKALENDMLLRICKFDDKTRGVHSFHKAESEITQNHPNKNLISEKIKAFGILIKELKEQRRHQELAHLKIGEVDNEYAVKYNLLPAIKLIAETVDLMAEKTIDYAWSDGRYEKYSLRKDVLESVDTIKAPMNGFY
jgi:hypothetical protein